MSKKKQETKDIENLLEYHDENHLILAMKIDGKNYGSAILLNDKEFWEDFRDLITSMSLNIRKYFDGYSIDENRFDYPLTSGNFIRAKHVKLENLDE